MGRKYSNGRSTTLEDVSQEATIALMTAAARYDPERGTRFTTYAWWHVRNAAVRDAYSSSTVYRLSPYMYAQFAKLNAKVRRSMSLACPCAHLANSIPPGTPTPVRLDFLRGPPTTADRPVATRPLAEHCA